MPRLYNSMVGVVMNEQMRLYQLFSTYSRRGMETRRSGLMGNVVSFQMGH